MERMSIPHLLQRWKELALYSQGLSVTRRVITQTLAPSKTWDSSPASGIDHGHLLSTCALPPNLKLASHTLFMKHLSELKGSREISERQINRNSRRYRVQGPGGSVAGVVYLGGLHILSRCHLLSHPCSLLSPLS